MWAALLAFSLAGAPHFDDLAGKLVGPLSTLAQPLADLRTTRTPTVENVRIELRAIRALESAARPLLARHQQPELVHRVLAEGWSSVEKLETALVIDVHGDGPGNSPEVEAIREMADARARNAHALAESERSWRGEISKEALQACWQEHLLSMDGPDSLDATATIPLEAGHVTSVEFAPALLGPRSRLGECLQTRLLGIVVSDDADAVELPLHFTSPRPAK